jgi:hypothetical protein
VHNHYTNINITQKINDRKRKTNKQSSKKNFAGIPSSREPIATGEVKKAPISH